MTIKLPISVDYINWRGKTRTRKIIPLSIAFGSTKYHQEPQWLLTAIDTEDKIEKQFALKDCNFRTQALNGAPI